MSGFGILLLTLGQLRRNSAEYRTRITCVYASRATRTILSLVAGPSSKMLSTNCQNRYPSPSKRSGLSRVRPRSFQPGVAVVGIVIAARAECGQTWKKAFAPACGTGETVAAKQFRLREGSLSCSRRLGLSPLSLWLGLPPAWKPTRNADLRAPQAAPSQLTHWAATLLSVLSLAAARACSATTSVSVTKSYPARFTARFGNREKAIGAGASVVFFVLPTCGATTARPT